MLQPQQFRFFQRHLENNEQSPTRARYIELISFRKFVLEKMGKTPETVKFMAPYFVDYLSRPQRLLYDQDDLYISQDYATNTYYIAFRDVTMIDVDSATVSSDATTSDEFCAEYLTWLIEQCVVHPEWRFAIYRSRKGLHVFPLHKVLDRDERMATQLELQCDFYYTIYTYLLHGCSIRLNRKKKDSFPIYSFVGYLGTGPTVPYLDQMVQFHHELQYLFQDMGVSGMK